MPQVPILMPQLGESISEATIMHILVQPGDEVEADQAVMEVETNKAVMEVTTQCGGRLTELRVAEGEVIPVGAVMGVVEATAEERSMQASKPESSESTNSLTESLIFS